MDSLIFELQIVFYFQLFLSANVRHKFSKNQGKCSNHFASNILGQYKLFLISEDWEGFTEPSEPSEPSLECHWSDNQYISNSNTVFSSFVFYSDFGFKYFLEVVGTKITI